MKIRKGFVSNSSSSSFLIFGWLLDKKTILALYKKLFKVDDSENIEPCDLYESLSNAINEIMEENKCKIEIVTDCEHNEFYLGCEKTVIELEEITFLTEYLMKVKEKIGIQINPIIHGVAINADGYFE